MTYMLPHHENQCQQSVNNFWSRIVGYQGIARILELMTKLLTGLIGQSTTYKRNNPGSNIIDIAIRKTCIKRWLDVECAILIIHYYQIAERRALYKSTDGPAGRPADNPPPIQTCWQISIETYLNWRFGCIDNLERKFGNGLVSTLTRTQSNSLEPFLTLLSRLLWQLNTREHHWFHKYLHYLESCFLIFRKVLISTGLMLWNTLLSRRLAQREPLGGSCIVRQV